MCEGIADELQGIDLGDKRLNQRSKRVIEALAVNPEASINASCEGWNETLAAYRFFDNDAVNPEQILQPHREATQRRMREHPVVLIVQDTTELDYTQHPPKDARCLNREQRFGLYEHVHLAVTPDKLCLGVVGSESYDRAAESLGKADERATLPIEEKESFRWLTGYRLACQLAAECPDAQIVSVADREADIVLQMMISRKLSNEQDRTRLALTQSDPGHFKGPGRRPQLASACAIAINDFVQSPNEPEKSSIDVLSPRLT